MAEEQKEEEETLMSSTPLISTKLDDNAAKIDKLFEESGGFGPFQWLSSIVIVASTSSPSFFIYGLGFLL